MKKDPLIDIRKERDLLDDLWVHIKGDYHANINNLKVFLYGILGIKYSWMLNKKEKDTSESRSFSNSTGRASPAMRLLGIQFKESKIK